MPALYPKEIAPLTSARFFAALTVVLLHYEAEITGKAFITGAQIFANGSIAVDFFFILSGFVLSHVYLSGFEDRRFDYGDFIAKRLARIYPLHFVTLLFYVAFGVGALWFGLQVGKLERYDMNYLPAQLLLVHAWGTFDHGTFNSPSWSVSDEWFAYLLFPVFATLVLKLWRNTSGLVTALSGAFAVIAFWTISTYTVGFPLVALHSNYGLLRIVPEFFFGMTLWKFGRDHTYPFLASRTAPVAIFAALVFFSWAEPSALIATLLCGLLILSLADGSRYHRTGIMSSTVAQYGGHISYALYMVHAPVSTVFFNGYQHLAKASSAPLWAVLLAVLVACGTAAAAHHLVEIPGQRFIVFAARRIRMRFA